MEVSGQLHAPAALLPVQELPLPIEQKAGWAPELISTQWRREKIPSLPMPGTEPRLSSP